MLTQPKQSLDPVTKQFPATHVFPELVPPNDRGRSYPVWQDTSAPPSRWRRLAMGVVALLSGHRPPVARHAAVNDRNKPERGSGSW